MSLRTFSLTTIILTLISFNVSANNIWDLVGVYQTNTFANGTIYVHDWNIVSENLQTGDFSGNGFYVPDPSVTWNITGTVNGNSFSDLIKYNNSTYWAKEIVAINSDGSFQGTFTDSNGTIGTFNSVSGHANLVSSVPEAGEWAMMLLGLPFLGWVIRRKQLSTSLIKTQ
ncbi:hypothetical protein [Methylomonas sp. AM2-LC]|uniref:hypothetical protein n=1 Tax=Methylomonas sp. AM2-LC TaxID=3153301 RepID=UPI003266AA88